MPSQSKRPCPKPGCRALIGYGQRYCDVHDKQHKQLASASRDRTHHKLYDRKWQAARKDYLHKHPLCVHCMSEGITKLAEIVDHIVPHRGVLRLFWDKMNWQSLCSSCHSRKTAREDGGFGNVVK